MHFDSNVVFKTFFFLATCQTTQKICERGSITGSGKRHNTQSGSCVVFIQWSPCRHKVLHPPPLSLDYFINYYCRMQGSSFLSRNKTHKLHFHNMFALTGTQTIPLENSSSTLSFFMHLLLMCFERALIILLVFQCGFQVLRLKSKRSITLLAGSEESKVEWLDAINNEIKEGNHSNHLNNA